MSADRNAGGTSTVAVPRSCLPILAPHIDHILAGRKTVEVRGSPLTKLPKVVALVRSGEGKLDRATKLVHGHIVGVATIARSEPMATAEQFAALADRHLVARREDVKYALPHAWHLVDVRVLPAPLAFTRKHGGVIFSNLSPSTVLDLAAVLP